MPTKTEAIRTFLIDFTVKDLAELYNFNMEVQVNVAQDNGEPIQGKSGYTGRMWRGFTDGIQTWKSFRIPFNAATEPTFEDTKLTWDLSVHAEGIGMTGWDWKNKVSKWIGFDFDSIVGHESGLTAEELKSVESESTKIPWITVRKSTSGQGLHLYVFLDNVPTATHTEHAALGRAILGKMTSTTGFEFDNKVDICGSNMWVWHRKMQGTNGLELIKQGEILKDIPINWKDHVPVIKGRSRKLLPGCIKEPTLFEQITAQHTHVTLDAEHLKLIKYLENHDCLHWYDQDNQLLVCHTYDLKQAHIDLNLNGIFETISTGKDRPDQNCFLYPLVNTKGGWVARRFSRGVSEANTWDQDSSGWTRCYYNMDPNLTIASRAHGGIEDEKGQFHFSESETAATAASALGAHLNLPPWAASRKTTIKPHKDGRRIVVSFIKESQDNPGKLPGWREEKGKWVKIFNAKNLKSEDNELQTYDETVRHLVTSNGGMDAGWVLKSNDSWNTEPFGHVKIALKAIGLSEPESIKAMGQCVLNSWVLVNKPFGSEYPGNREWNRNAVQLKYLPQEGDGPFLHPNWDKLINHIGEGLDYAVSNNGWCIANGILKGGDYIRLWIASLFQEPLKHLPYLFLYSPEQQTGKTSLHEALKLLITHNGYMDVKAALINPQGFNEEMKHAIICAVDECDLRQNKNAYNRIKDWITGGDILIHPKGKTPYMVKNISHFIHTGNNPDECPIHTSDSRITVVRVTPIDPIELIPTDILFRSLDKEAPSFLATLFSIEIPFCSDRLNIPVIDTEAKEQSAKLNRSALEVFIDECCYYAPGESIRVSEFWARFQEWLDPNDIHAWTKIRMGRSLPSSHPKGRLASDTSQFHIGNISFAKPEEVELTAPKFILRKDNLVLE